MLIYMNSGRAIDPANPDPEQIELRDIAIGLSTMYRYNGQLRTGVTVLVHTMAMHNFAEAHMEVDEDDLLGILLHDAPEYIIGDIVSPVKVALGPLLDPMERAINVAISLRLGISPDLIYRPAVKKLDQMAYVNEAYINAYPCRIPDAAPDPDYCEVLHDALDTSAHTLMAHYLNRVRMYAKQTA